ncbi:MAG: hypothetical protein JNK79_17185 [Chitinophagaceae bacterium]|nr:hypothetical protein [Chitinophagaceae bacterium]
MTFSLAILSWQVLTSCSSNANSASRGIASIEEYKKLRQEKLNHPRPLIYDNDGNDVIREEFPIDTMFYVYPRNAPYNVQTFLDARTTPLKGSDVTAIAYCTLASGFGVYTHNTKVGTFFQGDPNNVFPDTPTTFPIRTVIQDMLKDNTDALKVICDYAHENQMEVFWSNRMNDTHDRVWDGPNKPSPLWSKFKQDHPEYLFSTLGKDPPFGAWSAVDFAQPEIRDLTVKFFAEVCENYDIDGIELDFFRHLHLFKSVAFGENATTEQINALTDMITKIRKSTEEIGMRKGKPILVAVRVPDSFEYNRGIGIDLEKWMKGGLIDMIIGSCYFRLNPWEKLVKAGHDNNVKVYAGISESRIQKEHPLLPRKKAITFRARTAAAWQAGVDGLYSFDEYNADAAYLSQIGNAEKLKNTSKLYFVTDVCPPKTQWNGPWGYLKDGGKYYNLPILTPENPVALDKDLNFPMELGDESAPAKVALLVYSKNLNAKNLKATLNDRNLDFVKTADSGLSMFTVPADAVKPRNNNLKLTSSPQSKRGSVAPLLEDVALFFYRESDDAETKKLAAFCFDSK